MRAIYVHVTYVRIKHLLGLLRSRGSLFSCHDLASLLRLHAHLGFPCSLASARRLINTLLASGEATLSGKFSSKGAVLYKV